MYGRGGMEEQSLIQHKKGSDGCLPDFVMHARYLMHNMCSFIAANAGTGEKGCCRGGASGDDGTTH